MVSIEFLYVLIYNSSLEGVTEHYVCAIIKAPDRLSDGIISLHP